MSDDERMGELRSRLARVLAEGLSEDPVEHARQVSTTAGILSEAFDARGFRVTLVRCDRTHTRGCRRAGSRLCRARTRTHGQALASGRSVCRNHTWAGFRTTEEVQVGDAVFHIVRKEVLVRDRVVGFKHWRHTAYGDQAIAMLIAFGEDLDMEWLGPELAREGARDAWDALRDLATSAGPVTHERLLALIDELHER
jgi:hypothetical protein